MKKIIFLSMAVLILTACARDKRKKKNTETVLTEEALVDEIDNVAESLEPADKVQVFATQGSTNSHSLSPNDGRPKMVFVEGGTFSLGNEQDGFHDVTVSSFEIGMTEVTSNQYHPVIGEKVRDGYGNKPVGGINWYEALIYCNRLSMLYGYNPCYSIGGETDPDVWGSEVPYFTESEGFVGDATEWNAVKCDFNADGYRLPTLAEWTFAAMGGNQSHGYKYSGSDDIDEVGWYRRGEIRETRHDVATKKPNELGIYDMSGNVWEWCWNLSGPYATEHEVNPTGPDEGEAWRILCGGGDGNPASYSEIAKHDWIRPVERSWFFGMRLCRSIESR